MSDPPPYVELRTRSAYSFLRGASMPEALVARAAALGHGTLGLLDRDGLYGAPRFYRAARDQGLRALVGAEVPLEGGGLVSLLVTSDQGYRHLCRLISRGKLRAPKGEGAVTLDEVEEHAGALLCLEGHPESGCGRALAAGDPEAAARHVDRLQAAFGDRLYLEVARHGLVEEEWRNHFLGDLAAHRRLPLVATGQVAYAREEDRELFDVLLAIRVATPLDRMGRRLAPNEGFHLRSPAEAARRLADMPGAAARTLEVADRCQYTLADLGYVFPDFPVPEGETPDSYLRRLTMAGARARYGDGARHDAALPVLEKELGVIRRLGLAGYFLVVWDLARFCREGGIMAQGRGSAANSAVCYALGITAVDAVGQELLFERFLSEERGEWPDIDLDLPSGDPRERAIQYAYGRYGTRGAALVAVVITYRSKSASREVGKVMGFPPAVLDKLSKLIARDGFADPDRLPERLRAAGLDPGHARVRHYLRLVGRLRDLPRHLGQHPGGMILCGGRLDEVVPLENAAMPGRVVVQWDKDDCEDLGLLKIDLLGLGMMAVLERAVPMVKRHYGVELDLAQLPVDDPATYDMLCAADTVGVFQVESRAQMATLPRLKPRCLQDLVVEVAIIRPGPVQGNMVHPYLERRAGRAPVEYPHPCLEPVLRKTLGVALFQEQLLQMAMVAAGFTGGKAERLRRAFSSKRSVEAMAALEGELRAGMTARGVTGKGQDEIMNAIRSFANYGFPESHAASFALLVYASAYLKRHHPAVFYAALLSEWPMGFYHPATLVQDAQRRGQVVRPVDVLRSAWECTVEPPAPGTPEGLAVRIGLGYVKGLRRLAGARILDARARRPFRDVVDFRRRTGLDAAELRSLARVGALGGLGESRRSALWQVSRADPLAGPLFRDLAVPPDPSPLAEMEPMERTVADLETAGLTTGPHPLSYERERLAAMGVVPAGELMARPNHGKVRIAGLVICRQKPQTRTGVIFLSLEDETGIMNAMVTAALFEQHRALLSASPCLVLDGTLQVQDGAHMVMVRGVRGFRAGVAAVASHDWH